METCPPHRGVCALRRRRRRRRRRRWWWWWWGSGEHGCDGGFIVFDILIEREREEGREKANLGIRGLGQNCNKFSCIMFSSGTCSGVEHVLL
jgi:hypothetical protein